MCVTYSDRATKRHAFMEAAMFFSNSHTEHSEVGKYVITAGKLTHTCSKLERTEQALRCSEEICDKSF